MIRARVLLCAAALLLAVSFVHADWVTKSGETDYACHKVLVPGALPDTQRVDGMPDFDQKQDSWVNGQNQWSWCGLVAAANCLWWYDSKFERIWLWGHGQQHPTMPTAISDHYPLVHSLAAAGQNWDDHDPANVMPFITSLAASLPGGVVPPGGVNAQQIKTMIETYLALPAVNLTGHYSVTIIESPTFDFIYHQVEISQDVIMLLGFWQPDNQGNWVRFGGHWVTIAGADTQLVTQTLSWSDPCIDNAENGKPGVVWNGFLLPHNPIPGHIAGVHNDAGNVSHDYYTVQPSNSPGGGISPAGYNFDYFSEGWYNFAGLNFPSRLEQYRGNYDPTKGVHTEIEDLVVVCPNFDYGDLQQDYPTINIESCGPAHPLSDKAWLGDCISAEIQPNILNQDGCDEGVQFIGLPWAQRCAQVSVRVLITTGSNYAGEPLYLNAWKDGNLDGDFDDGPIQEFQPPEQNWLCASEWCIKDAVVTPHWMTFTFTDPTGPQTAPYDLRMRFRLTSQPVGRYGYGGLWYGGVSNARGTYDIDWTLGEVEDYILHDQQLAVNLLRFNAIPGDGFADLVWATASETNNQYFSLARRGGGEDWHVIAQVHSHGNSSSQQNYTYRDDISIINGRLYEYTLTSVDLTGLREELATASVTPYAGAEVITSYALHPNFPNPFNASTTIAFDVPESVPVTLKIYNVMGEEVATLLNSALMNGPARHEVRFDARQLTTGLYIYRLTAGTFTAEGKMLLVK
jgi:hypothetical protein